VFAFHAGEQVPPPELGLGLGLVDGLCEGDVLGLGDVDGEEVGLVVGLALGLRPPSPRATPAPPPKPARSPLPPRPPQLRSTRRKQCCGISA
jgi:hypothetical protein